MTETCSMLLLLHSCPVLQTLPLDVCCGWSSQHEACISAIEMPCCSMGQRSEDASAPAIPFRGRDRLSNKSNSRCRRRFMRRSLAQVNRGSNSSAFRCADRLRGADRVIAGRSTRSPRSMFEKPDIGSQQNDAGTYANARIIINLHDYLVIKRLDLAVGGKVISRRFGIITGMGALRGAP